MGKLTTHVLDVANGCPGEDIRVELFALAGDTRQVLKAATTNADGRCDQPLLEGDAFVTGEYELVFHVGEYFAKRVVLPEPRFLNSVVLRFGVADAGTHYHVPLLVSPWSYGTYRGS